LTGGPARSGSARAVLPLLVAAAVVCSGCHPAGQLSGTHDATTHHSFENVEHWAAVFDDPARDAWQKPQEVIRAMGIRPGQTVADLGTGTGYFLRYLSPAVGPGGTVFALDTETALIEHVRERASREGWTNVRPLVCPPDSPGLPEGSTDLVLVVDTWHHLDDRLGYLSRLRRILAPGGRVAIVDFRKDASPPPGPPAVHRLDRSAVIEEFRQAGWQLVEEPKVLDEQYILIFRPA